MQYLCASLPQWWQPGGIRCSTWLAPIGIEQGHIDEERMALMNSGYWGVMFAGRMWWVVISGLVSSSWPTLFFDIGTLLFGNPSHAGHRLNFSVHRSDDGGRTWPRATVVYAGDAAYSDMAFTRNGSVAVLFERGFGGDPYKWVSFGVLPVPQ